VTVSPRRAPEEGYMESVHGKVVEPAETAWTTAEEHVGTGARVERGMSTIGNPVGEQVREDARSPRRDGERSEEERV
jgi:hypothetical protein